jgi:hypothetical protein
MIQLGGVSKLMLTLKYFCHDVASVCLNISMICMPRVLAAQVLERHLYCVP